MRIVIEIKDLRPGDMWVESEHLLKTRCPALVLSSRYRTLSQQVMFTVLGSIGELSNEYHSGFSTTVTIEREEETL
jgi:hypothetical protein